jgi:hypothetical protein
MADFSVKQYAVSVAQKVAATQKKWPALIPGILLGAIEIFTKGIVPMVCEKFAVLCDFSQTTFSGYLVWAVTILSLFATKPK